MNAKKFILNIFLVLITLSVSFIGINFYADPLSKFHLPKLGAYFSAEREFKDLMIKKNPHNAIVIGSSKTTYLNPSDISSSQYQFFNAAFSAALPEEMLAYLKKNFEGSKLIIFALDEYMFNEKSFPFTSSPEFSLKDKFNYLFSMDTFVFTVKSLFYQLNKSPENFFSNGARNSFKKDKKQAKMTGLDYELTVKNLKELHFKDYTFSLKRLEVLKDLKNFCIKNHLRLIVLIHPLNQYLFKVLIEADSHDDFMRFKTEVKKIFPDVYDLSEKYPQTHYYYRFDPYHFTPKSAKIIYQSIIDQEFSQKK